MSLPPQKIVDNDLFVVNRIDQRGQVETYKTKARDIGVFLLEGAKPPGSHPEDKYINDGELNVYGELQGYGAGHINLHSANEYCEGKLTFDGGFFVSGTDMDVKIQHDYLEIATNLACLNGGIDGSTKCLRLDMYWLADNIICHGNGLESKGNCIGIDLCTHSGLVIDSKGCLEVNLCPGRGVVHSDLDGCLEIDLNYLVTSLSCDGLRPGNGDPDSLCIEIDMAWLSANIRCGDPTNPLAAPESGLIDGGGCIKVDPCWVSDQWNLDNDNPSEAPQDTNSIDVQGCRIAINHEWLLQWAQDNIHDIEVDGLCISRSPNGNLFEEKVYIYQDVSCIRNYTCDNNQTITFKQNDLIVQTYTPCQQLDNELIAFTYTVHQNGDHRAEFKPWISDEHLDVYRHQWKQEGDLIKGTFEPLTTDSLLVIYEHEIRQTGKFWSTFKPLDEHRVTDIRKIEWYQSGDQIGTWEPLYGDGRIDVYHHTIKQDSTTKTTFKPLSANSETVVYHHTIKQGSAPKTTFEPLTKSETTVVKELNWKQNGSEKGKFQPLVTDASIDVYSLTINVTDEDGNVSSSTVFEPLNGDKTVTIEAGGGGGSGGNPDPPGGGTPCENGGILEDPSGCLYLDDDENACAKMGVINVSGINVRSKRGVVINSDENDGTGVFNCNPANASVRLEHGGKPGGICQTSAKGENLIRVAAGSKGGKNRLHRSEGLNEKGDRDADASGKSGYMYASGTVGTGRHEFQIDVTRKSVLPPYITEQDVATWNDYVANPDNYTNDEVLNNWREVGAISVEDVTPSIQAQIDNLNFDTILDRIGTVATSENDGLLRWGKKLGDTLNSDVPQFYIDPEELGSVTPFLCNRAYSTDSFTYTWDEDENSYEEVLKPEAERKTRFLTVKNDAAIALAFVGIKRVKDKVEEVRAAAEASVTRSAMLATLGINEYNNETAAANSGLGEGEVYWDLGLNRMRAVT